MCCVHVKLCVPLSCKPSTYAQYFHTHSTHNDINLQPQDFLSILGPHFRSVREEMRSFLATKVWAQTTAGLRKQEQRELVHGGGFSPCVNPVLQVCERSVLFLYVVLYFTLVTGGCSPLAYTHHTQHTLLQVRVVREAATTPSELGSLCSHVMLGAAKAGKAWDLGTEQQLYFIRVSKHCTGGYWHAWHLSTSIAKLRSAGGSAWQSSTHSYNNNSPAGGLMLSGAG